MMEEMLRIFGLKKQVAPAHVRSFAAAKSRLNAELDRREDAFTEMVYNMAGKPGSGRKAEPAARAKKRD